MTDDIVKRLRYCAEHGLIDAAKSELAAGYGEAAEEIQKLRAALKETLEIASRNETGNYVQRAKAALGESDD